MKKFKLKKSAKNSIRYLVLDSGKKSAYNSIRSLNYSIIRSINFLVSSSIWSSINLVYNDLHIKLKRKK